MTKDQLVAKFKEMRKVGKAGRRESAMGHLFGIIFDGEIVASSSNAAEIAREAGLRDGDDGGIRDGQNLAEYVTVKPGIEKRWRCVTRSTESSSTDSRDN